jgi:hypothetical protein
METVPMVQHFHHICNGKPPDPLHVRLDLVEATHHRIEGRLQATAARLATALQESVTWCDVADLAAGTRRRLAVTMAEVLGQLNVLLRRCPRCGHRSLDPYAVRGPDGVYRPVGLCHRRGCHGKLDL